MKLSADPRNSADFRDFLFILEISVKPLLAHINFGTPKPYPFWHTSLKTRLFLTQTLTKHEKHTLSILAYTYSNQWECPPPQSGQSVINGCTFHSHGPRPRTHTTHTSPSGPRTGYMGMACEECSQYLPKLAENILTFEQMDRTLRSKPPYTANM